MAHFIGVDWGTSAFRAYLYEVNADGVVERMHSRRGIGTLQRSEVAPYLQSQLSTWQVGDPNLPIIGSGMIGSDLGLEWVDYLPCPLHTSQLSAFTRRAHGSIPNLWLVPGLSFEFKSREFDSMRGEETQLLGLEPNANTQLVCMPGTHSKWILLQEGHILAFRSALTGELFSCLANSTLLRGDQQWSDDAFTLGVIKGGNSANLLSNLFSVRSTRLFKTIGPEYARAYLSGLLIGSEMLEMRALFADQDWSEITLVSEAELATLYCKAIATLGFRCRLENAELAICRGHRKLFSALNL
jgi:2-dehydro-3-deoxygalactonokinase